MRHKDYRQLLEELKVQGWAVEQTSSGHWKAVPPDKSKAVVHFSTSADAHAMKNALGDLRHSGFIWPPPPRSARDGSPKPKDDWLTRVEREAPVSSKPEPPAKSEERLVEGNHEEDMDRLYNDLKDAKAHLALADEILSECRHKLTKAQEAFDSAVKDKDQAATLLRQKKAAFDRAFGEAA